MSSSIDITMYFLVAFCLVTTVRAAWWDDFTNNLATDLTPLIALFGEKTSTQFLSESTTILDNFIFAMAPLGILTGVVSAIRVCGGPSLRAFIGRAQEAGGVAEAELCSSTSRDVCELYHNGAIVRAFGRPKILEVVFDPSSSKAQYTSGEKSTFGIFLSREYFQSRHLEQGWTEHGQETSKKAPSVEDGLKPDGARENLSSTESATDNFAPNPNLSLNIGITKHSDYIHWGAAVLGFFAQASVLVFGGIVQYRLHWLKDEDEKNPIERWAFPFILSGTICVCGGMFFCAFLVNDSTKERKFQRKKGKKAEPRGPRLYVVQPGNQVIGDQTFDSFLFSSEKLPWTDYITSWRKPPVQATEDDYPPGSNRASGRLSEVKGLNRIRRLAQKPPSEISTFAATSITMIGFVLQFLGLRSMHSAVSLLQLGVTLGMGVLRALLRTQRLRMEQNLLGDRPDEVNGHELDWLALQMGKEPNHSRYFWCTTTRAFVGHSHQSGRETASQNAQIVAGDNLSRPELIYNYRIRLAELTQPLATVKSKTSNAWGDGLVVGRSHAQQLSKAIQNTLNVLSTCFKATEDSKNGDIVIDWKLPVSMWEHGGKCQMHDIVITIRKENSRWTIDPTCDPNYLEAIIGLCSWSITSDPYAEEETFRLKTSIAADVPIHRIVSAGSEDHTWGALQLWIDSHPSLPSTMTRTLKSPLNGTDPSPATTWRLSSGELSKNTSQISHDLSSLARLVGWQIIDSQEVDTITMVEIASKSIPTICSHEIYQSFLSAILKHFDYGRDQVKAVREANRFRLEHRLVTKVIECFEMSGLGSRQDAYLIIIPALKYGSVLSFAKEAIPSAYQVAEGFRKDHLFREAEKLLYWAWDIATTMAESRKATMIELGELYRYALFSGDKGAKDFGRKGIDRMSTKQAQSSELEEIYDRYLVLRNVQDDESLRTVQDVLKALGRQDRAGTLLSLSLLRNMDLSYSENGRTVISLAAEKGWYEVVRAALEIGSVVDSLDHEQRTPLSYAAEHGRTEVVRILLDAKALPNRQDSSSWTPLEYAASNGHVPVMEILLKCPGVNMHTKDNNGRSLLHLSALNGKEDAIIYLCDRGAQINDTDRQGCTPLVTALLNNRRRKVDREKTAKLLLDKGATLNITVQKEAAWRWALQEGEFTCAEFLLKHDPTKAIVRVVLRFFDCSSLSKLIEFEIQFPVGNRSIAKATKGVDDVVPRTTLERDGTEAEAKTDFLYGFVSSGLCELAATCFGEGIHSRIACEQSSYKWVNGIMDLLQVEAEITITDELLARAARQSIEALFLLLARPEKIIIGENVIDEVMRRCSDDTIMKVVPQLFSRAGQAMITKLAAERILKNADIKTLFLDSGGDKATITEKAVEIVAGEERLPTGPPILAAFLDRQAPITEEVLRVAAGNCTYAMDMLTLLIDCLDKRRKQVTITEAVVINAAYNLEPGGGDEIFNLLLNRRGEQVKIRNETSKAAASNESGNEEILKQVTITEDITKAVASNRRGRKRILELLLKWQGKAIVRQGVIEAAVSNDGSRDEEILEFLLEQSGGQVAITEDILKAAAGNERSGKEILEFLLNQRYQEVKITEEVVEAAVSNQRIGESLLKILLDRRGEQFTVTERVINAAIGNRWRARGLMRLLYERGKTTESLRIRISAFLHHGK